MKKPFFLYFGVVFSANVAKGSCVFSKVEFKAIFKAIIALFSPQVNYSSSSMLP